MDVGEFSEELDHRITGDPSELDFEVIEKWLDLIKKDQKQPVDVDDEKSLNEDSDKEVMASSTATLKPPKKSKKIRTKSNEITPPTTPLCFFESGKPRTPSRKPGDDKKSSDEDSDREVSSTDIPLPNKKRKGMKMESEDESDIDCLDFETIIEWLDLMKKDQDQTPGSDNDDSDDDGDDDEHSSSKKFTEKRETKSSARSLPSGHSHENAAGFPSDQRRVEGQKRSFRSPHEIMAADLERLLHEIALENKPVKSVERKSLMEYLSSGEDEETRAATEALLSSQSKTPSEQDYFMPPKECTAIKQEDQEMVIASTCEPPGQPTGYQTDIRTKQEPSSPPGLPLYSQCPGSATHPTDVLEASALQGSMPLPEISVPQFLLAPSSSETKHEFVSSLDTVDAAEAPSEMNILNAISAPGVIGTKTDEPAQSRNLVDAAETVVVNNAPAPIVVKIESSASASDGEKKRKKKQVCRKTTGSSPIASSSNSQASVAAELNRLKFTNPGRMNEEMAISWHHGNVTRGFRRQHTHNLQPASALESQVFASSLEPDRLRQTADPNPINWTQEGGYMTRGHVKQMEMHDQLCGTNSSDPPLYDSRGLLLATMEDRCDCMRPNCPGCFLPCRRCHNTKCGPLCRILRNFHYEKAEVYI